DGLATLVKEEFGPENDPWISRFLLYQENMHTTPEPWIYFGAGRSHQKGESFLLLASPRPSKGKRIVANTGGRVETISEDEFQTRLAKQASPPPAPSSPASSKN